jgi:acyl carrier protein
MIPWDNFLTPQGECRIIPAASYHFPDTRTMTNSEKLTTAFSQALQIDPAQVTDDLAYNQAPQWDSVAHMALVAELEGAFDIMLDTDDILAMSSVAKAREILQKYDVAF